jgi:hypothetical protein
LATKQNHDCIRFGGNEPKKENIFGATVIAFQDSVTERRFGMELDLLVSCPNQVVDDMGRRGVATGAAEPFTARKAFDNAAWIVNPAVSIKVSGLALLSKNLTLKQQCGGELTSMRRLEVRALLRAWEPFSCQAHRPVC